MNTIDFHKQLYDSLTCCEAVEVQDISKDKVAKSVASSQRTVGGSITSLDVHIPKGESAKICNQTFLIAAGHDVDHVIIAFRGGSKDMVDGLLSSSKELHSTHGDCGVFGAVHANLWKQAESIPLEPLPAMLMDHLGQGKNLIFTGYSTGGAVAAILTLRVLETLPLFHRSKIRCITFGAPLWGDKYIADHMKRHYRINFYNVVSSTDPLPKVLSLVMEIAGGSQDERKSVGQLLSKSLTAVGQLLTSLAPAAGVANPIAGAVVGATGALVSNVSLLMRIRDDSIFQRQQPIYSFCGRMVELDHKRSTLTTYEDVGFDSVIAEMLVFQSQDREELNRSGKGESSITFYRKAAWNATGKDYGTMSRQQSMNSKKVVSRIMEKLNRLRDTVGYFDSSRNLDFLKPSATEVAVMIDADCTIIDVHGENMMCGLLAIFRQALNGEVVELACDGHPESVTSTALDPPIRFVDRSGKLNKILSDQQPGTFSFYTCFGAVEISSSLVTVHIRGQPGLECMSKKTARMSPNKVIQLLLLHGISMAQADFVRTGEIPTVPEEVLLLDKLLGLVDGQSLSFTKWLTLPDKMREFIPSEDDSDGFMGGFKLLRAFPPGKSDSFTFKGIYNDVRNTFHEIWINSEECTTETSKQPKDASNSDSRAKAAAFGTCLEKGFEPLMMILEEYLNYNLESSMYRNSYSLEVLRDWQSTKNHARVAGAAGMVVGMLPTAPLAIPIGVGAAADMAILGEPHFLAWGTTIVLSPILLAMSIPASLIGGLMAGSWIVGRSVVKTVLRAEKGPHMFSSLTRKKQLLHKQMSSS